MTPTNEPSTEAWRRLESRIELITKLEAADAEITTLTDALTAARAENALWRQALEDYGEHPITCSHYQTFPHESCDCGLNALLPTYTLAQSILKDAPSA